MESQAIVEKAEFDMKSAKTKFLEKKHAHDRAAQELRGVLTSSPAETDDVIAESEAQGELF